MDGGIDGARAASVERGIAKYRASFDKLAGQNSPIEILDRLPRLAKPSPARIVSCRKRSRTDFALKGLEAGARARALVAKQR